MALLLRAAAVNFTGVDLGQGWMRRFALNSQLLCSERNAAQVLSKLGHRARWPFLKAVKMPSRPWTEGEIKRANLMRAAGYSYGTIDKALGRFPGGTQQRLEIAGHGSGNSLHVTSRRIPENLFAERAAREVARNQRSLTQDFCGDPPPGYSALHGKTGLR